jgi:hypothetical protein
MAMPQILNYATQPCKQKHSSLLEKYHFALLIKMLSVKYNNWVGSKAFKCKQKWRTPL